MAVFAPTVVVIDDDELIGKYLAEVLTIEGYECKCFRESLTALAYLANADVPPDLVMTDLRMPGIDGLEVLRRVRALSPKIPVILISGIYELATALEAAQAGAADYLLKPANPAEVLSMVARHVRSGARADQAALQKALASFLAHCKPADGCAELPDCQPERVLELLQALSTKRYETMQHSLRVASYATLFGQAYGLGSQALFNLRLGALLHDIGKIAVPRNVLLKPGPLDEREWQVMRGHPQIGFQLLAAVPDLPKEAAQVVYAHHERYDGAGYPCGLRGEEIPLGARLFSIVDTVDAITCNRPYRAARGFDVAFGELKKHTGTQFDPSAVEAFLRLPEPELINIRDQYPDSEELSLRSTA